MSKAHAATETAETAVPGLAERMHAFRSLGGNCEFGFVQRYCGAEPSGLFRFSYTPLADLLDALATDFEKYGAPSDLVLMPTETGVYYSRSRTYNVWSNTQQRVGAVDHDALLAREYGRVAHLKAKMLADLASGTKIFVRKAGADETDADFLQLAEAVWRHGPSTLLRVREANPKEAAEPLRRTGTRVLEGGIRRFAPDEQAWELDLESWVALCDAAYAERHGVPLASLANHEVPVKAMRLPRGFDAAPGAPSGIGLERLHQTARSGAVRSGQAVRLFRLGPDPGRGLARTHLRGDGPRAPRLVRCRPDRPRPVAAGLGRRPHPRRADPAVRRDRLGRRSQRPFPLARLASPRGSRSRMDHAAAPGARPAVVPSFDPEASRLTSRALRGPPSGERWPDAAHTTSLPTETCALALWNKRSLVSFRKLKPNSGFW